MRARDPHDDPPAKRQPETCRAQPVTLRHHGCRTHEERSWLNVKRCVAGLILALSLTACVDDNDTQIAKCHREMLQDRPEVAKNPRTFYQEHTEYMLLCMRSSGFVHDVSPTQCDPDKGPIFDSPYCYAPTKALPRLLLKAELLFSR
jgi:hypothetical protein